MSKETKNEITYFDENGEVTTNQDQAITCIIRQLDEKGNLVNQIFGMCK